MRHMGLLALLLTMAVSQADAVPTLPDRIGFTLLTSMDYPDTATAQQHWRPIQGTKPVALVTAGPRKALKLPCNLSTCLFERTAWDLSVSIDASDYSGIQFRFLSEDSTPVAFYTLYLKSGPGWYKSNFAPKHTGQWDTIRLHKSEFETEDTPDGWRTISGIRITAWRGEPKDTTCYLADLGYIGGDTPIRVLQNNSAIQQHHPESENIALFARIMTAMLDQLGLEFGLISDLKLSDEMLAGTEIVLIPYAPALDTQAVSKLVDFVQQGGKIISFYQLPARLCTALGYQPGPARIQKHPGEFAAIVASDQPIENQPETIAQNSMMIMAIKPLDGSSRAIAYWQSDTGQRTDLPALLLSDNGIHMTHVLIDSDREKKQRLLLAMVNHFLPASQLEAARQRVESIGLFNPYTGFQNAFETLSASPMACPFTEKALEKATTLRESAIRLLETNAPAKAMQAATEADNKLMEAHCSIQPPTPATFRGVWCHDAFGIPGMTWDQAVKILADNGFNVLMPNMLWAGTAYYPSEVLPTASDIITRGDQIKACLAACKKYGVECHVWKVCFNTGGRASQDFLRQIKTEQRYQVLYDGTPKYGWLCPSHPDNQQLELDAVLEVARNYQVDGIHLDYIRYSEEDTCFCRGCLERFQQFTGNTAPPRRIELKANPRWLEFRRAQITGLVKNIRQQLKNIKPELKLSAAVWPNWPEDRDTLGQDWKVWCDAGYLDFICPMDYVSTALAFKRYVQQQSEWAGKVPCYPGIGLSTWSDTGDILLLLEQIKVAAELPHPGFMIFEYKKNEAERILPLCGLGITRK